MFLFQSANVPLSGAVESCPGGRSQNQDDFGVAETPLGFVAIVCDGMGGGPGGKTASAIVKKTVLATLCGCNQFMDRATALKMAVSQANEALEEAVVCVPELAGMGSTLVVVLIDRQSALVAHVGDSRCYRLHGHRVKFCTEDHSLVAELVKKRVMTVEQARISPQSNVITRHLGNPVNNTPQIDDVPYCRGDRFVLCTDGVWGCMPQAKLTTFMAETGSVDSVVERLSQQVDSIGFAEGGGHDNHTVLIVDIAVDSELAHKATKRRKCVLASAVGTLGVAVIVGFTRMFFGSNTQMADEKALQHYSSEDDHSYIFDGRTTPIAITDSLKADSAKIDSVCVDTAATASWQDIVKRKKRHCDSLKTAQTKKTEAKDEERESSSKPNNQASYTKEQKALNTIKVINEKLKFIKNCKKKTAEDVTKDNTMNMKAVTNQLVVLKSLNISRYQGFIESVYTYVVNKDNTYWLTRPTEKTDESGYYTTARGGIAVVKRIERDLVRLENELKGTNKDKNAE